MTVASVRNESTFFSPGLRRGARVEWKKLSVVSWDENASMNKWIAKTVEAYGFLRTDTQELFFVLLRTTHDRLTICLVRDGNIAAFSSAKVANGIGGPDEVRFFVGVCVDCPARIFAYVPPAYSATSTPTLLKAKKQAESKAYIFLTSHDEIVEKAKKEGKLRVLSAQEPISTKAMVIAFNRKYPFIEVNVEEVTALGTYQRILQELKAGLAKNWDVNYLAWDSYAEYLPHLKKFDILGMAEHQGGSNSEQDD